MALLTSERAWQLLRPVTSQNHLLTHALAVGGCMEALAAHFDQDTDYWLAIGILHDYDYDQFPDEHLKHTEKELLEAGVDTTAVRAIMAHGWGLCTDVEPHTALEKSLYAVDELSGLISATSLMRPTGISDLETKSVLKKFKDKKFAAGCNRELIQKGADLLDMQLAELIEHCICGMKKYMNELGLAPKN